MMRDKLPERSRQYGVGKEIAGKIYVHRQYEACLGEPVINAKKHVQREFEYHVVKYDLRSSTVSFIQSPEFDLADEPIVGKVVTVNPNGVVKRRKQLADPQIYHHKWLFVADDYGGFDVEASKARSRLWMVLDGVDRSRIGKKSYWEREVLPLLEG